MVGGTRPSMDSRDSGKPCPGISVPCPVGSMRWTWPVSGWALCRSRSTRKVPYRSRCCWWPTNGSKPHGCLLARLLGWVLALKAERVFQRPFLLGLRIRQTDGLRVRKTRDAASGTDRIKQKAEALCQRGLGYAVGPHAAARGLGSRTVIVIWHLYVFHHAHIGQG